MSSAVISTTAAPCRPFVFDEEVDPDVCVFQSTIQNQPSTISPIGNRKPTIGIPLVPASQLEIRPAPEMVSSGIPALDALTGGLPRGCITEICGPASSGRTTVLLAALAAATRRGEFCVVVDASDALHSQSVAAAGVELDRLLWVRCGEISLEKAFSPRRHRGTEKAKSKDRTPSQINHAERGLEQALRAADLLLESGGFGLIVLDLGDLPPQAARRIPLTTWFRFRRAIEHTPAILLAIEQQAIAGSCSSLLLQLGVLSTQYQVLSSQFSAPSSNRTFLDRVADRQLTAAQDWEPSHSHVLTGLKITVELIRSRAERKPARSVIFETRTAWAG